MRLGNNYFEEPNICPHCHVVNEPEFKHSESTTDLENESQLLSLWRCTNKKCGRKFPVLYQHIGSNHYELSRFLVGFPKGPDWPKPIEDLKSGKTEDKSNEGEEPIQTRFIKTYLQSLIAENDGLDEIAGMGYRKAIEYLVKDWAIQEKPKESETINGLWLSAVIEKYYDGDLKGILERATWLGNDQANYNKLFDEYDIDILKELIDLIMVELDRRYKLNHFNSTIKKRK